MLAAPNVVVSGYSKIAIPLLEVPNVWKKYDLAVISLEDMGFTEPVSYDEIAQWGLDQGLKMAPPHLAPYLRLQFVEQPDWQTDAVTGEFFVASEPISLDISLLDFDEEVVEEFSEFLFSVVRDDEYPG